MVCTTKENAKKNRDVALVSPTLESYLFIKLVILYTDMLFYFVHETHFVYLTFACHCQLIGLYRCIFDICRGTGGGGGGA